MKLSTLFVPFLAALALSGSANAALFTGTSGAAANVTDYSTGGLVAFDLDVKDFSRTTLNFVIEQGDLQGPLSLNALFRNLSGANFSQFSVALNGITFAAAGTITPAFGTVGNVALTSTSATIAFSTPEPAEFQFGNVFPEPNQVDWLLQTANLQVGDAFSITASVPEPTSVLLMLSGLAAVGVVARRRRRQA